MKKLSARVIGCAVQVSRTLGAGFLERVYENALSVELEMADIRYERQKACPVYYRDTVVGEYFCDFLIEGGLIVELKALKALTTEHEAQLLNYLKATQLKVGLLLNFGTQKLGIKRIVNGYDDYSGI